VKESTLGASEFKARCLRLLEEVAEHGHSIVVTKRGRPIARLMPVSAPRKSLRGNWKGRVKIKGDIVRFNVADEWDSIR
jgi:prevent-host-death family protein